MEQGDDGRPLRSEAGIGKSRSGRGWRRPGPSTWIETKPSGFRRGANAYLFLAPDRAERVPAVPISVGRRDAESINQLTGAPPPRRRGAAGPRRSSPKPTCCSAGAIASSTPCVPQGVRPRTGRPVQRPRRRRRTDSTAPSVPTRKRAVSATVSSSGARSAICGWPSTRSTRRQRPLRSGDRGHDGRATAMAQARRAVEAGRAAISRRCGAGRVDGELIEPSPFGPATFASRTKSISQRGRMADRPRQPLIPASTSACAPAKTRGRSRRPPTVSCRAGSRHTSDARSEIPRRRAPPVLRCRSVS
jgi:hypothetical protein